MPDMPDNATPAGSDPFNTGSPGADWINAAAARVASGQSLDNSGQWNPSQGKFGTPPGYAVHNGQLVQDAMANWNPWVDALGIGSVIAGAALLPGGASGADAASGAGPLATGETGIGPTDAALSGATTPASLAPDVLPATSTVPNIGSLAPATTPSTTISTAAGTNLPNWLTDAQKVGNALSGFETGRANGRAADSFVNNQYANAATNLYNSELAAPSKIAHNAVRGDILSNAKDVSILAPPDIPVPQISGGLRPSMFSDATRQTGRNISTAAANTPVPSPTAPNLPPPQQANGLDTTLNTAALIAGLAKPVGGLVSKIPWGSIF